MLNAKKAAIEREERDRKVWERKVRRAERFLLALRNKLLTAAFEGWRVRVVELARQRRRVNATLMKMTHRVLAAAFDGWAESAARAARHRRLAARAVRKMTRRTASRAFGRWAHAAGEAQRKAAATERHANRLWRRKTLAAFNGWRDSAATRRRNRAVAMRVVGAVAHQTAYRAFTSWARGVAESIRKKIAVRRALARMRRRALVDCFYAWLNSAEDARAAWSRAARAEGLRRRGERRLRAACHRAWAELAANAGRRRDAEDDAVERATLAVLAAHDRVRRTRLVAGVFGAWRGTRLGVDLARLRGGVDAARTAIEREREQAIAFLFVRRVMKKRINVLHAWRRYVVDARRRERVLGDNMRRVLRERKCRLAVRAWADAAWERVQRHRKSHAARRHLRARRMERCVAEWRAQCPTRKRWLKERAQKLAAAQRSGAAPVAVGSSVSQIAFDGWSASAMVRTAVYRDGQEVDEPGTTQQPVGDEGTRAEAGTHETIASAAAMAALRASFEEFDPGDVDDDASGDGSGPIARLSGVPTVPTVPTVPSPAVGSRAAAAAAATPSPPSPLHLDWNFDAPFAENVASSSPATLPPLDDASDPTGFDRRANAASASSTRQRRAGEGPHRAGRDSTGAGARVVGGLESRYREVMGEIATLEGSLPPPTSPPPTRATLRGSDRDGLERLAGAESRATSALHAARDDQAELRRIFSRSTSPYEPSDE